MSKIKCALCGAEWTNKQSTWAHPENDCPLAGSYTYRPIVLSVNKAIEASLEALTKGGKHNDPEMS